MAAAGPLHFFAILAAGWLYVGAAWADETGNAIREAQASYASGNFRAARTALGEALQFLTQRAATALGASLPGPLPGWKADDVEENVAQMSLLGGGIQASRKYEKETGGSVELQATADSPLVGQMAVLLGNPALAGAMGKLVRVGGQRAIQTSDQELQLLIDNRILLTVSGDASMEDKIAYAGAADVEKMKAAQ